MDLCQKAQAAGVSFIAVHARTPQQRHEPVETEIFRTVSDACSVPVIANGDVKSISDAELLYEKCGVRGKMAFSFFINGISASYFLGVMSARALLQNPALFAGYDVTPVNCIRDWVRI